MHSLEGTLVARNIDLHKLSITSPISKSNVDVQGKLTKLFYKVCKQPLFASDKLSCNT